MRIGINIPKELHQRIQPLKGAMNISQICREALEAHVEKYENSIGWLDSDVAKGTVAERCEEELRRKAMVEVDWETMGYQDAKGWVQAATLADWDDWNRYRNHADPHRQDTIWMHGRYMRTGIGKGTFRSPGAVPTFLERHREYTERIHKQDDEFWEWMYDEYDGIGPFYDLGTAEQQYGRAWMTFTLAVWEMICREREERQQRWRLDRTETRLTHPEPEVPEHIRAEIQRGR
ncbi:MAG: hypothetical protein F4X27_15290 [Chloroflexi bacterium]|nr:hypothetical protein [Chloroflexota bacterium]